MKVDLRNIGHDFVVYDGVTLSDHFVICTFEMPLTPPVKANTIEIDGKPGAWFTGRKVATRDILMTLGVLNDTEEREDIISNWLELSDKLVKDRPCKMELGNGYYVNAMFTGESNISSNYNWSYIETAFTCFDPYIYNETHVESLKSGNNNIYIYGKKPAFPVFDITGATTVTLTNNGTGEKFRVEGLTSSQHVIIDMEYYTCTVNGIHKPIDLTISDFWSIAPEDLVINLSGGSGTMTYKETYL